ncbi:PASTA domain-containing protein [Oenococcus sicerae]|uniref:PASTA domain-containing protein n=1 Tax=Oenococcus sicerae TaxID=2203724 RepID=A0AAJ1RB32_9LACO|nr:PASTA domain-containing protein [Oenococcus sicerae]MDN6899655.1 PASTA domain-containing protein [Oenococcus sicerae]
MSKGKMLGKLTQIAAGSILGSDPVEEAAAKIVNDQMDKRKDYVKVPDIVGVPLADAEKVLSKYQFKFIKTLADPDIKYANKRTDIVLATKPKGGSSVPPNTFIKLIYADQEVLTASQLQLKDKAIQQNAQKESNKLLMHKLLDTSKSQAGKFSDKLKFNLKSHGKHSSQETDS